MSDRAPRSGAAGPATSAPRAQAGIAELVRRYGLPATAGSGLRSLIELLAHDEHAPTAVREPATAIDVHLADSLVALELEEVRRAHAIVDIGSGAGFPGLPLAIALPHARMVLLESNARRGSFLQRAVAATGAAATSVMIERAEEWPDGLGAFGLVLARALAPLSVVAEYAAPLLGVGGALVAWRGQRDVEGERAAARAADELGLVVREPHRVFPYDGAEHRYLHVMSKVMETPPRFPRRAGMAVKRPLGALGPKGRQESGRPTA